MGLFSKRTRLPKDVVSQMAIYGKIDWSKASCGRTGIELDPRALDSQAMWETYIRSYMELARADEDGFLTDLAQAVVPIGGWSAYGAERLLMDVVSGHPKDHPGYVQIMDASVAFLRSNGVPPMLVSGYEWDHWINSGGTIDTWINRRPLPPRESTVISPLAVGETRKVAQDTNYPGSNMTFVRADAPDSFAWVTEARYSDEDPTRSQWDNESATALYDLYIRIGFAAQIPTCWYDPELEPFFPLPQPSI